MHNIQQNTGFSADTELITLAESLKSWFVNYVRGFFKNDVVSDLNFTLKEQHTYRVVDEIKKLSKDISLNCRLAVLSELAALFHDLGRFEQYAQYQTFVDKKSENHARLSLKILNELSLLRELQPSDRKAVIDAVGVHNQATIPSGLTSDSLLLAKMLRDADKLDIWRIVTDYYSDSQAVKNKSLELDLPDLPQVSERVFASAMAGQTILSSDMQTLDDFKIMQIGWVYDLNFAYSFNECKKRNYIAKIKDAVADKKKAEAVYARADCFMNSKLKQAAKL
jgi:HD superfamily phosphohydrolase YqeK